MAASAALTGTACTQPPPEKILPYVNMPEGMTPGDPVFYASTLLRGGYGVGVLVETQSGRPIKIEGNTAHPASLGAADAQAQAAILTLWDPERSHTVMHENQLSTHEALFNALLLRMEQENERDGQGLRLLTGSISSPTLLAQIGSTLARYPGARWHMHDASDSGPRAAAARQVFGVPARSLYRLDRAQVVLSVDAELFGPSADGVRNARDFMAARQKTPRARLYALESSPNLCGALADSRIARSPGDMESMLEIMAAGLAKGETSLHAPAWMNTLYRQLLSARGACVVAPGHSLSARSHVIAWRINMLLGNLDRTVFALGQDAAPRATGRDRSHATSNEPGHPAGLFELVEAMRNDQVSTLIMLDVNPAYDTPGMLAFSAALKQVPCSVHMGLYRNETAHQASWHVPMTHELEAWGDARSHDGTPSIVQPVITPLYGGRSPHELMSLLADGEASSAHQAVRSTWRAQWQEQSEALFERRWRDALHQGVIKRTDPPRSLTPAHDDFDTQGPRHRSASSLDTELIAVFANDSNLVSDECANNAWLQELPRPYTKITWDNAALISPATASKHALQSGDVVQLKTRGATEPVLAPIWILPGQADGVITLPLGYGRIHAGNAAENRGFDAYLLQDIQQGVFVRTCAVTLAPTDQRHEFACTQHELGTQGREPVRMTGLEGKAIDTSNTPTPPPSLYPEHPYNSYAWGMTVDLDACIGCNACTIACQAENNIPVVGPEQVAMGREMHWIRIDLYRDESNQRTQFQPMACQHCENAPCEVVCPVGATMHDSEGLNVQVYNRCVGTRFCSNNCPYKVRHFNFFQFSDNDPSAAAHANPDVTVRQRGVMEKCTYCVQRISRARIQAQKAGRPIQDGEVVTACQATCPTNAIVFGDTNDPDSEVSRSKTSPRNYAVLEELNTKPRTTYLARIDDPAAHLEGNDE